MRTVGIFGIGIMLTMVTACTAAPADGENEESTSSALTAEPSLVKSSTNTSLALRLGKAKAGDLGFAVAPAAGTKCYIKYPGPPPILEEVPCDTIVIVETKD
jgi:hypothetical protein